MATIMKQLLSEIHENKQITLYYYSLTFDWELKAGIPVPCQFITIRVSDSTVPLLRRPFAFSAYDKDRNTASIIFQKRGTATEILAGKQSGEQLDIIGPLGNTFQLPDPIKKCIIVAGGIGLGPMIYSALWVAMQGIEPLFIFGSRDKAGVPLREVFGNINSVICTDDGSEGYKGTTVDYLNSLKNSALEDSMLLSCGPDPMLRGCHYFAQKNGMFSQVSREQIMACGVGACMGCVVKVKQEPGYARVCSEGPVFNSQDVIWT
jgi:dihydroorotate dehydrogenase electron transfer subunit